jgi:orotate phosphoribosyltransferase
VSEERIARLLLEVGAIELRSDPARWFTWSSGERAPIYCDHRVLLSHPDARAVVADALAESIRAQLPEVQVIAGAATGGIAHAAWVAERLKLPMVYVRAEAKGHGQAKQVEGEPLRGRRVVLIEDLISFGGSAQKMVQALAAEGGQPIGIQAIFSYGFAAAEERLASLGVPWYSLTTYDALLRVMNLDAETARVLLEWRAR